MRLPGPFGNGWTSFLVMEATMLLFCLVVIILDASIIATVIAAILLQQAWVFWIAFGPVRCPTCRTWQRRRSRS